MATEDQCTEEALIPASTDRDVPTCDTEPEDGTTSDVEHARVGLVPLGPTNESSTTGATRRGKWALKYKMKCRFCGGRFCLRCSEQCALRCKNPAIKGLHSHWITDSIVAMQRPSSRLLEVFDVIEQMKRKGITAIFNLTEAGEHPYCGDGLEASSGFPYLPEAFMREGISFFNFPWEDMTTPPLSLLMDIVRVVVSCLRQGGKVAVHCHAGYGRTGLVIASVIVLTQDLTAQQAVALVREKRPLSIQTKAQVGVVHAFADFVRGVRVMYHFTDHARVTLGQHLTHQAFLLHGQESVELRWLPKPLAMATRMLAELTQRRPVGVAHALAGVTVGIACENSKADVLPAWGMAQEQQLKRFQFASNGNDWQLWDDLLRQCHSEPESVDPRVPAQLLHDYLAQLADPAVSLSELRQVLPQCAESIALSEAGRAGTLKSIVEDAAEGRFSRLNMLPPGQIRLLQCLGSCLRDVGDALAHAAFVSGPRLYQKACLRMGISLVQLNRRHEAIIIGRDIAADVVDAAFPGEGKQHDSGKDEQLVPAANRDVLRDGPASSDVKFCSQAIQLLVKDWNAPARCRPYTRLECLSNRPEVHHGDEEYWHKKRRSVVPPKDLILQGRPGPSSGRVCGKDVVATSQTSPPGIARVVASDSDMSGRDDADLRIPLEEDAGRQRDPLRRRSLSTGNVHGPVHLPRADLGPLDEVHISASVKH